MQPKIGEIITVENVKYITELAVNPDKPCIECHLRRKPCWDIACTACARQDEQSVIFKEVKEMEIKIQIPDNCELIKDGDTYIVKKKSKKLQKKSLPRSWKEFCMKYPIQIEETFIDINSDIQPIFHERERKLVRDRNQCVSKEEAEAFLALMQLRQLRKAWVGDWEQSITDDMIGVILYSIKQKEVIADSCRYWANSVLSFPNFIIARDFLNCFKDLCEKAKILL